MLLLVRFEGVAGVCRYVGNYQGLIFTLIIQLIGVIFGLGRFRGCAVRFCVDVTLRLGGRL